MEAIRRRVFGQDDKTEGGANTPLPARPMPTFRARAFPCGNWVGAWTLFVSEIKRFVKIWPQTLLAPVVGTLLLFVVFSFAMGEGRAVGSLPFLDFLLAGLIVIGVAQSAFAGPAVSLILAKIQGTLVDVLMAPLSAMELLWGYVASGMVRGLAVGSLIAGGLYALHPFGVHDPLFLAYHAVMGALMLALTGLLTGLLGEKFDHLSVIQNFVVLPAVFLSGTFFSLQAMPPIWGTAATFNPFFYMIDGFRYGLTGVAESWLLAGLVVPLLVNLCLLNIAFWLLAQGTRLKP